jgi:hypothetical protein
MKDDCTAKLVIVSKVKQFDIMTVMVHHNEYITYSKFITFDVINNVPIKLVAPSD